MSVSAQGGRSDRLWLLSGDAIRWDLCAGMEML